MSKNSDTSVCDAKLLLKEYGVFNIKPSQWVLPMYDCHSTLHDGWGEGNNIARPVIKCVIIKCKQPCLQYLSRSCIAKGDTGFYLHSTMPSFPTSHFFLSGTVN